MTSKNLFFNLMKENAKRRLWTIALTFLVFIFMFPVAAALMISDWTSPERLINYEELGNGTAIMMQRLFEEYQEWTSLQNGAVTTFIILFAVVCGVSGFSYLHSKKKIDFFHSIPVRREKLFAASYINGVLFTAVPYLLCLVLASLLIQIKTGLMISWGAVLSVFLSHMAFYLLLYSTVILAVVLTGNTIVSLLGTVVFFAWVPAVTGIAVAYCSAYFQTYYGNEEFLLKTLTYGSPFALYIYSVAEEAAGAANAWIAVAAALVLSGLSAVLYRLRPSEAAGRAMAFKKSEPVIKLLLVVPLALFSGFFFGQMKNADSWGVFGLVCGLLISYCVIEIIYHFDFRRLFGHKKQLVLCGTVTLAVFAFFRFDLMGYDTYLPSEAQVEASGIYTLHFDNDVPDQYLSEPYLYEANFENHYLNWRGDTERDLIDNMRLSDTKSVLEIARSGIEGLKRRESSSSRYWYSAEEGTELVRVAFHLKSGRTVYRSYYAVNSKEVQTQLEGLYDGREYKEAVYPILQEQASDIAGINYRELENYSHIKLPDAGMKDRILATYQEELAGLTASMRKQESPIAAIQFRTNEMQEMIDILKEEENSSYNEFNRRHYYPVYPSFVKTIALLKECGIAPGEYLESQDISKIDIVYTPDVEEENDAYYKEMNTDAEYATIQAEPEIMTIDDEGRMKELLDACISEEAFEMNTLNPIVDTVRIIVYIPKNTVKAENVFFAGEDDMPVRADVYEESGEFETYRLYLDADQVPEFVRNRFPGISD